MFTYRWRIKDSLQTYKRFHIRPSSHTSCNVLTSTCLNFSLLICRYTMTSFDFFHTRTWISDRYQECYTRWLCPMQFKTWLIWTVIAIFCYQQLNDSTGRRWTNVCLGNQSKVRKTVAVINKIPMDHRHQKSKKDNCKIHTLTIFDVLTLKYIAI